MDGLDELNNFGDGLSMLFTGVNELTGESEAVAEVLDSASSSSKSTIHQGSKAAGTYAVCKNKNPLPQNEQTKTQSE